MAQRYDDPILNDDLPDPLYDEPSPYKGRVYYGFSEDAEKFNGRAAMMGFTVLFLQEVSQRGAVTPVSLCIWHS